MTKQLFKFAGAILDSYDDPAFVETAQARSMFGSNFLDADQLDKLADNQFAVKIASRTGYKRRYPVYNADITKLSCYYFGKNYDELPVEIRESAGSSLARACDHYGIYKLACIAKHVDDVAPNTVETVTKVASAYNVGDIDLVKEAETRLSLEMSRMNIHNRCYAATEMYKQAGDSLSRVEVWDYVEKPVAGPLLDGALDDRAAVVKTASPEHSMLFEQLRADISELEPAAAVKALVDFDKMAGLNERYNHGFIDPYRSVYGGWMTPASRVANKSLLKEAQVIDGFSQQPVSADVAKGLSVERHVFNLQKQFPKGSADFQKAASSPASPDMEKKFGPNYVKARQLHFGA